MGIVGVDEGEEGTWATVAEEEVTWATVVVGEADTVEDVEGMDAVDTDEAVAGGTIVGINCKLRLLDARQ